jgi:cytochrome c peroxidase
VVRFYNAGGKPTPALSDLIKPLHLTEQEMFELIAFLGALTDPVVITRPALPPQKEVTAQRHIPTDIAAD